MKSLSLKKYFVWFLAGFIMFFLFRLAYGYMRTPENGQGIWPQESADGGFEMSKKNYATEKFKNVDTSIPAPGSDQKYEKVGSASSVTEHFDEDQKKVRDLIKQYEGVIQFEQMGGLSPSRYMQLGIGVPPSVFDSTVAQIQRIGSIRSLSVNKTDKTNEYRQLLANIEALEKSRQSMIELKSQSGRIDEYINLENKVMELDERIRELGVNMGEFDTENEFCTVKFTLKEKYTEVKNISMIHRVKVALEWTIKYYGITVLTLLLFLIAANLGERISAIVHKWRNSNMV
jgi:Domain of unknown function (DUF4349)